MKATILLVDDDPLDLKAIEMMVNDWDMDILCARSGEEALETVRSRYTDLVISDVRMSGMSGEDLVKVIADEHPGLPVILVTGQGDIKSAVKSMKLGAFDYIVKPPDSEELLITINKALEHSRLRRENARLRGELAAGGRYGERLIGRSDAMLDVFEKINTVAPTDTTVLLTGETGTGKEIAAQMIHYRSRRSEMPFIAVNCAAVNANLIESELFGHEKGAFTGALTRRRGRFEDADGGTLFLDEIGETTTDFQAKLLRVLQEGTFERVGGNEEISVDVRIIASTNRDLEQAVSDGTFREDLYYRLCVIPIRMPPLRERGEDIGLLACHFAAVYGERYGFDSVGISDAGLKSLRDREWNGNVRELQHLIERAVVLSENRELGPENLAEPKSRTADPNDELIDLQDVIDEKTKEHLVKVLDSTGWRKKKAAALLGIDRATLYRMLKKFSLQ